MTRHFAKTICIIGALIILSSCKKNNESTISNKELLTNNSSKTWHLTKITINNLNVSLFSCITDDKHIFQSNGDYLIDNAETIYKIDSDFYAPPSCVDTIKIIDSLKWRFNSTEDSLVFEYLGNISNCKILGLDSETLKLERVKNDTLIQIDYFTINY